jgi:hypothetical protein
MKKIVNYSLILLACVTLAGFQSCKKDLGNDTPVTQAVKSAELKNASMNTFYSSTLPVGNGTARAWIKVSNSGDPLEAGINLSGKALMNLPLEQKDYVFTFPKNKGQNFYTHILMDWNPQGHEPLIFYGLPHFDFHFYIVPEEQRLQIPFMAPPYMDPAPEAKYVPSNYAQQPGLIPGMGAHWVDLTSPELPPSFETFTHTFIWGSYAGKFIFWEPMITLDYLLTKPDHVFPVSQPSAFQTSGWYPADYKISYSKNPDEYSVSLVNLTYHNAE